MIAVLKKDVTETQIESLTKWFVGKGLSVHLSKGDTTTIMGLVGDTSTIDTELIEGLEMVEKVTRITEPYKKANRKFHPHDTVIDVCGIKIGGDELVSFASLCHTDDGDSLLAAAQAAKAAGAQVLCFGCAGAKYSPYSQSKPRDIGSVKHLGIPIAKEIIGADDIAEGNDADIIIIGASNMQNYELLHEVGKTDKPVILKRSLAGTLTELLVGAEHIMAGGNENVILCERGIRTFETYTKNTLDLSAIPALHALSHLPVIADISHATGISELVRPMACAAAACDADGIMAEINTTKDAARTGAVTDKEFADILTKARKIKEVTKN